MKKQGSGILIIAVGHLNYGRMAANLCASIKLFNDETKVALAYSESAISRLNEAELAMFDEKILVDKSMYKLGENTEAFIRTKTYMDKLTPFENTLFLDADMIWFGKTSPSKVLESLLGNDFVCANRGHIDFSSTNLDPKFTQWANVNDIKALHEFTEGLFYQYHSEFMYFEHSKEISAYFKEVRKQYDKPLVSQAQFAGAYPDEVAFGIAGTITGVQTRIDNYNPSYWHTLEKSKEHTHILAHKFNTYSIGGNFNDQQTKDNYNRIAKYSYMKMGLLNPYQISNQNDKRRYLKERQLL